MSYRILLDRGMSPAQARTRDGSIALELRAMSLPETSIAPNKRFLTHRDACGLVSAALKSLRTSTIVIDMSAVEEATTSAFARLVLLRRQLRRQGRDLRLRGLRDRTEILYHLNRLETILPRG